MLKTQRDNIRNWASTLTDEELVIEYKDCISDKQYILDRIDILADLCLDRGIKILGNNKKRRYKRNGKETNK